HVGRPGRLLRVLVRAVVVVALVPLTYEVFAFAAPAFAELAAHGYGATEPRQARLDLNMFLRCVCTGLSMLGTLAVAAAAATGVTAEREAVTWDSLTASDLEGYEVLQAKMLGAVWRPRRT